MPISSKLSAFFALMVAIGLMGCAPEPIISYRAPKDTPAALPQPILPQTSGHQSEGLHWDAPAAWTKLPDRANRVATYRLAADESSRVELAITTFSGDVGGELANLNRWRGQLSLAPITAAELESNVMRMTNGELNIVLVSLSGEGENKDGTLGAWIPYENATWFFKVTGPAAELAAYKEAFVTFLKNIHGHASS